MNESGTTSGRTGQGPAPDDRLAQVGNAMRRDLGDAADQASRKAGEYTDAATGKAREMADAVADRAGEYVQETLKSGAGTARHAADAARKAAEELDKSSPELAGYAREAADAVEGFSDRIARRDVKSLIRDADDFARREPVAFFAMSLAAGFAVARFLGSSAPAAETSGPGADLNRGGGSGSPYRGGRSDSMGPMRAGAGSPSTPSSSTRGAGSAGIGVTPVGQRDRMPGRTAGAGAARPSAASGSNTRPGSSSTGSSVGSGSTGSSAGSGSTGSSFSSGSTGSSVGSGGTGSTAGTAPSATRSSGGDPTGSAPLGTGSTPGKRD